MYARISETPSYDGDILVVNLFRSGPHTGEILDLELWPLLELDVGVFGLRGKILPFGAAAGFLFYYPDPEEAAIEGNEAVSL